jgi:hypothetical protein
VDDSRRVVTPDFALYRARWFTAMNVILAAGLLVLALAAIIQREAGFGWMGGLIFLAVGGAYLWQAVGHAINRDPVVAVMPRGLALPGACESVISWHDIVQVAFRTSAIGGARVDIDIDPAIRARMHMGQRFMGDAVVSRRGVAGGISILTTGLDGDAAALYAAIRRHWPTQSAP